MNTGILGIYSFSQVAAFYDNAPVTGFWEGDDAIIIEPHADLGTPLVGADGKALVSITTDYSVMITLKLQPDSPTHQKLMREYDSIINGLIIPKPFSVTSFSTQEGGSAIQTLPIRRPTEQYGVNAAVREWQLFAGLWAPSKINYVASLAETIGNLL